MLLALSILAPGCGRPGEGTPLGAAQTGAPAPRVIVLGLDGATFDLIQPWIDAGELPNLARLVASGASGPLESTILPQSPPAWTTANTGKNPGRHAVFDFFQRDPATDRIHLASGADRRAKALWQILSEAGLGVVVMNVPITYPPEPVRGIFLSGFITPKGATFAFPPELQQRFRDYRTDVDEDIADDGDFLQELETVTRVQFETAEKLMRTEGWSLFYYVCTGTDRIQHRMWYQMDPSHPLYPGDRSARYHEAIHDYWKTLDARIGTLLGAAPKDATVLVLSDHGFGPRYFSFHLNNWFVQKGWLVLKPASPHAAGASLEIDPSRTKALVMGGPSLSGQVFIYRKGAARPGTVTDEEYEPLRTRIAEDLKGLRDPTDGKPLVSAVWRREELYTGPHVDGAADLIFVLHDNLYGCSDQIVSDVPPGRIPVTQVPPLEGGSHRMNGILIASGPGVARGRRLSGARILDFTPTVLALMGRPIPSDMDGRVMTDLFVSPPLVRSGPPVGEGGAPGSPPTADQEEEARRLLKSLGYVE